MRKSILLAITAGLLASTANAAPVFNRVASFAVAQNHAEAEETSSEIIAATEDGMMVVYSDSPGGGIGFVDITEPAAPKPAGYTVLDGEPTSVTVIGDKVYVAVNTSESYTNPSGQLLVIDLASKEVESAVDLGGQPDSIARNAAGTLLAIAIENERDEDAGDGGLPQMPGGFVVLLSLVDGVLDADSLKTVELAGLAEIGGEDPEAEYVTINGRDEVAVTLQENNEIVVINGTTGEVINHFSAGAVDLEGIDTNDNGEIAFTDSQPGRLREPDAIKWIDDERFAIANEGDWNGGSRSFSIFNKDGTLEYDSGNALDVSAAQLGHYPDKRSDAKGVEPEGLEVATYGDDTLIFVAEERSSLVAVYKDNGPGAAPEYVQTLPSGIAPEGSVAIASRNLFVTANEADLRGDGLSGSHVMIYERAEGEPVFPQIISDLDADGQPIGWAALSGAVADADEPGKLYAVSDSFLGGAPAIYTIDASAMPARITAKTIVTRNGATAQKLDLEGITLDGEGGFWLASEGRTDRLTPHALFHVDADGEIQAEVAFPEALLANETRFGAEGITMVGDTLWVAIQREWKDDPKGQVKLLGYNTADESWSAVRYPLDEKPEGAWVGLSEITAHGDYVYIVERDNQLDDKAVVKKIYRVPVADLVGAEIGGDLPVVSKEEVRDLLPDLKAYNGYVLDKVESFAIDADGTGYVITDNDGVDDSSGETHFFTVGTLD